MENDDTVYRFLQVSAAYLCGAAYSANLRAAFARNTPHDPVSGHVLRYQELIAREASGLLQAQLEAELQACAASANSVPSQLSAESTVP
jgi:hypothetical protein